MGCQAAKIAVKIAEAQADVESCGGAGERSDEIGFMIEDVLRPEPPPHLADLGIGKVSRIRVDACRGHLRLDDLPIFIEQSDMRERSAILVVLVAD